MDDGPVPDPAPKNGAAGAEAPVFPSEDWVGAWVAIANQSREFEASGAEWEGVVGGVIEADPNAGVSETLYVRLDGRRGKWLHHAFGTDSSLVEGSVLVLRASYSMWKELVRQELHPIKGILLDKIRVQGHLPFMLKWTRSMVIFAELAGRVDTRFVDEHP